MSNTEMPNQPTPFETLDQQTEDASALKTIINEIKELTDSNNTNDEMNINSIKEQLRSLPKDVVQILLDETNKIQQQLGKNAPDGLFDTKYFLMGLLYPEFTELNLLNIDGTLSYITNFKKNNNLEKLSDTEKDNLNKIENILKKPTIDGIKWIQQFVYDNLPDEEKDSFVINNQTNMEGWDGLYSNSIHEKLCTIIEGFIDNEDGNNGSSSSDNTLDDSLITPEDNTLEDDTPEDNTSEDDNLEDDNLDTNIDIFTKDFLDTTLEDIDNRNINYNKKNIYIRKHRHNMLLTYWNNNEQNNKTNKKILNKINNILNNPNKKNIQKLQEFLYKRVEKNYDKIGDITKKLGKNYDNLTIFQSKNKRNGERDGLFGDSTGNYLLTFLGDIELK